jgi:Plasmid recombination enzyme
MAQHTTRPYYLGIDTVSPHSTKRSSTLPNALAHNRRTLQAAHGARSTIDPALSHLNYTLAGMGAVNTIITHWKGEQGRLKARKNAPHAVEVLFTLPANWTGEARAYFTDCVNWACGELGASNLLSADVHLDEAQPHCHVLFLPIVDTPHRVTPQAWLNPIGDRAKLHQRRERFYSTVGTAHGLTQPPKATLRHGERQHLSRAVIEALHQRHDPLLKHPQWQVIRAAIECDPAPWCEALGIDTARVLTANAAPVIAKKLPSFAGIMTRPQRMEKSRDYEKSLVRGFDAKTTLEVKPLSCVRGSQIAPVFQEKEAQDIQSTQQVKEPFNWAAKKVLEVTARAWLNSDTSPTDQSINATPSVNANKAHEPIVIKPPAIELIDTLTESTTRERVTEQPASDWHYESGDFYPQPSKQSVKPHFDRMVSQALADCHHRE